MVTIISVYFLQRTTMYVFKIDSWSNYYFDISKIRTYLSLSFDMNDIFIMADYK